MPFRVVTVAIRFPPGQVCLAEFCLPSVSRRPLRGPSVSIGCAARSLGGWVASGKGDRLRAGDNLFHHLGGTDDGHTFCQLVWVDAPRFRAGTAEPYLALIREELTHQIA